jgi:DNA-binding XRE family transcriptional regulator
MAEKKLMSEEDLAWLARGCREKAGKNRLQAAKDLGVSHVSIHRAEEKPEESLTKLRIRMIEKYSSLKVVGPVFYVTGK